MSAREADRIARRDLLSILQPTGKNERGMLRRMRGVSLFTRPYTTHFEGLCRQDVLTLHYGATASDDRYEDAPLRPYAIEASALYRVTSRRFAAAPRDEKFGPEPFDENCPSSSADASGWFYADNDLLAATGVVVAGATDKRLADGTLKPSCETEAPCLDQVRQGLRPENLASVATCPAPANERCFDFGGGTITIRVDGNGDTPINPAMIKSIRFVELIVVT